MWLYVSILTRLNSRVQHDDNWFEIGTCVFQSSPGLIAGCNVYGIFGLVASNRFQSSPGLIAGCNSNGCFVSVRIHVVSILTRLNSRVQRNHCLLMLSTKRFQSSPGLIAGCNARSVVFGINPILFQSSPGLIAGCNPVHRSV